MSGDNDRMRLFCYAERNEKATYGNASILLMTSVLAERGGIDFFHF